MARASQPPPLELPLRDECVCEAARSASDDDDAGADRGGWMNAAFAVLSRRLWLLLPLYVLLWPLLELAFALHVRRFLRARSASGHRTHDPAADPAEVQAFWRHILTAEPAESVDVMVRGWFIDPDGERERQKLHPLVASPVGPTGGAPRAGNVLQLIVWTLYNVDVAAATRPQLGVAEDILRALERKRGARYAGGTDPSLTCMRHTLGGLEKVHKPLLFYVGALAAARLVELLLSLRGFQRLAAGGIEYWRLAAAAGGEALEPIVLMHGVGGIVGYLPLCLAIAAEHAAPLYVPLFPSCSLGVPTLSSPPPLAATALAAAVEEMLAQHAPPAASRATAAKAAAAEPAADPAPLPKAPPAATFVAHSMGTASLAALLKTRPQLVRAALFVDPICFLLYRRDVLYNFLYRQPALHRTWWRPSKWFQLALHRMITTEPGMQTCFRREFWWSHYVLHPSELDCEAAVLLSERDAIVPSGEVQRALEAEEAARGRRSSAPPSPRAAPPPPCAAPPPPRPGLRVAVHEGAVHGYLVLRPAIRRGVLEALAGLRGGS